MMKKKRTLRNLLNDAALRAAGLCLFGSMAILSACDKSDNTADGLDTADNSALYLLEHPAISVEPFGGGSPATRAVQAMEEERQAFNVGEELGNIITLRNSEVEDTPQTRAFANGTYYRIVIYRLSEWNAGTLKIYAQRLCKTGSADYLADLGDSTDPVYLKKDDYRIFCYSFNKTTADKLVPLADGAANVPLSDGDDFLSSDIKSLSIIALQFDTNVALGTITLKHRCCRLIGTLTAVAFTSTGIAASPAPSLSATSTFTTAGTWSIKNTNFTGTATQNVTKSFTMRKSNNDYTGILIVLPFTNKALSTAYNFKPNGASKNITASNKQVTSSTTFSSGGSYSFTIKALNAYVVSETNPVQIGSYKWAYANLNGTTKTMESKPWISGPLTGSSIPPENGTATANSVTNDYWRWNVLNIDISDAYPTKENTWNPNNDPCRIGLGTAWKVPPITYFDDLIKYVLQSQRVYINGETMTTTTVGWVRGNKTVGCVFVDKTRGTCIFLPATGTRVGNTYGGIGNVAGYHSATPFTSANNYSHYLYFNNSVCRRDQYLSYYARPIRCAQ